MPFFTDSGLQHRPSLAVDFAEAMEQFAVCEGSLGALYLVLNSNCPIKAFKELEKNVNFSQRLKMVRRLAEKMNDEERALILAVTDRASTAAGLRNKIAHGSWGYSDSLPDSVLLVPTSKSLVDIRERLNGLLGRDMKRESSEIGVMVYEHQDFNLIRLAAIDATAPLDILTNYLMNPISIKAELKDQVLSDPLTHQRFNKRLAEERVQLSGFSKIFRTFRSRVKALKD